jgi:hypothetical protein
VNANNKNIVAQISLNNGIEEAYYKEIAISDGMGKNELKEKIQLNAAIKNGDYGLNYEVIIKMSFDKSGSNAITIGNTKSEILASQDGTLNFGISFIIDYFFEKNQYLFISVKKSVKEIKLESTVGRIMGSKSQTVLIPMENLKDQLCISASKVENKNQSLLLNISANFLINFMGPVFYLIKKPKSKQQNLQQSSNLNDYFKVQKSETINVGTNATQFKPMRIPTMFLCNGDLDYPFEIEFHSLQDKSIIGKIESTINTILTQNSFTVDKLNVNINTNLQKDYTFIDYLAGGIQLSLGIAIDFTGSNGNPYDINSLHKINNTGSPNSYQLAIRSCGDILAYYDYDQTFPVYGYGAKIPNSTPDVKHCFHLNFSNDPNVRTIDGVLDVYINNMPNLIFAGPTFFAPIIRQTILNIRNSNNKWIYNILLILTDGMINDMDDTVTSVVEASNYPLSIIIVGIGTSGDFDSMNILDGDGGVLTDSSGRRSSRDIVQFVPFFRFANDGAKLAEQVLAEIPRQLVDYYRITKQPPSDPILNIQS